ncbi:hypothetical protein EMCRGX_G019072 [Ephydatia muelleri]
MSASHHLHEEQLNSSEESVLKKVYLDFLQEEQIRILVSICTARLQLYTPELEQAKQSKQNLEQVATYMVLAFGELHPITELQALETQWKDVEKEKATHIREIKELEHNIAKFQRECREAAQRVEDLLAKHDWIATEKQYFGKANTAYDFGAYNLKEATRKLTRLQEEKDTLSKNVNMRAMNMLGKAEEKYNDLMKKKSIVENDKSKIGE